MSLEILEFLLANRRWDSTCLRCNIATPEQIQLVKRTKRVHVESNGLRRDRLDMLILKAIKQTMPHIEEWDDVKVILNRNVTCKRHVDGNVGRSWILWLGDFEGGALQFDSGERITEKNVWHEIDGRVAHWNEPHTGTKYGIVLYRRQGTTKRELIGMRSKLPRPET
jgi:hypothetical protein